MKYSKIYAIEKLCAGNSYAYIEGEDRFIWNENNINPQPTEEEIQTKIQELEAAEPMRLLRLERDRRIALTDWEVQRNIEMGIDNTDLIAYRIALRNLPQEIESGNVDAPTLDESGNIVFNSWPER